MFAFPLSSWVYHQKLQLMTWIIQFGFELDVYQGHELGGMYWYLQHLTRVHQGHLRRMRIFYLASMKGITKAAKQKRIIKSSEHLHYLIRRTGVTQLLADALNGVSEPSIVHIYAHGF